VNSIQIADDTFVAASPERVAGLVADRAAWKRWWPDLALTLREDRAEKGVRWLVSGALEGTMEVWLEPCMDGTVVHYFLHAEPSPALPSAPAGLPEEVRRRRVAGKAMAFEVKAWGEQGRVVGGAAVS
jgi:hypothetical protein